MSKLNKLKSIIKEFDIDMAYISYPKSVFYFTGFNCNPHERYYGLFLTKTKNILLVPELEYNRAIELVDDDIKVVGYKDEEKAFDKINSLLDDKVKKVALEYSNLTLKREEELSASFNYEIKFNIDKYIIELRKVKDDNEVIKIKKACELSEKALDIAKNNMKEGITELELKAIIDFEMKKLGVENMAFDTMVLFGENASNPHGISGDRKLKRGEFALFDLGVEFEGYASDITRTIAFGDINEKDRKIYNIVKKANMEAISKVKEGMKFKDLDKIARDIIEEEGYGEYFTHRLGHGMGIDVHEFPDVSASSEEIVKKGMVFTIEPGIYIPNGVGIRIEDDVLVTESGVEVLTKYEK